MTPSNVPSHSNARTAKQGRGHRFAKRPLVASILLLCGMAQGPASAADYSFLFPTGGNPPYAFQNTGAWSAAAQWTGGVLPGVADDVAVSLPQTYGADTLTAATLDHDSGNDTIHSISAANQADILMSGGSLTLLSDSTVSTHWTSSGGTVAGATLTLAGPATFTGGAMTGGSATLLLGASQVAGNLALTGGRMLDNQANLAVSAGSSINLDPATGGWVRNNASATLDFQGDGNAVTGSAWNNYGMPGYANNGVENQGTLRKSAGTGTSTISTFVNNNGSYNGYGYSGGTVDVQTGTLALTGGSHTNNGSFTGAGTVAFSGGSSHVVEGNSSFGVQNVRLDGASRLTLGSTYNGGYYQPSIVTANNYSQANDGSVLDGAGMLVVNGAASLGGRMEGNGLTQLRGASQVDGSLALNGGRMLENQGTLAVGAGNSIALDTATGGWLRNNTGATLDFQGDGNAVTGSASSTYAMPYPNNTIENQGTLRKSAGTGTSTISTFVNNNGSYNGYGYTGGTVDVQTGTLVLTGGSHTNNGSFTGAGTVAFSGGSSHVVEGNSSFGVQNVRLDGASRLTLGSTYNGGYYQPSIVTANNYSQANDGSVLDGAGTLVVNGAASLGGRMEGSGLTQLRGASQVDGSLALNGGRMLENQGTLAVGAGSTIALDTATGGWLRNNTGATLDFQGDGNAVTGSAWNNYGMPGGTNNSVENQGTLRKSAGTGTSTISSFLNNNGSYNGYGYTGGTVDVQTGTLALTGGSHTNNGSFTGAGTVAFSGGSSNVIDGNSSFGVQNVTLDGASRLTLNGSNNGYGYPPSVVTANNYSQANDGSVLDGAGTLVVNGTASLGGTMTGGGATRLLGASQIAGNLALSGGRMLENQGTLAVGAGNTIALDTATGGWLRNSNGATLDFQGDGNAVTGSAWNNYGMPGYANNGVENQGTLRKSAGTGTSTISTFVNNNGSYNGYGYSGGTVDVQTGTLALTGGSQSYNGSFTGAGTVEFGAGSNNTLGGNTSISSHLVNNGTMDLQSGNLALTGNASHFTNDGTLRLSSAATLTAASLNNASTGSIGGYYGNIDLGGSGTLANAGHLGIANTIDTLTVNGGLDLQAGGNLDVEFAGLSSFDKFMFTQSASLGGALNLYALNGYMPNMGDTFDILNYATGSGGFSSVNLFGFAPGTTAQLNTLADRLSLSFTNTSAYDSGPISTALTNFNLSGTGQLPLGRDLSGANSGYQFVDSEVKISLSSQRPGGPASTGTAQLTGYGTGPGGAVQNGDVLDVQSFFDVYFDISIKDIDPNHNFASPTGDMPDGTTLDGSVLPVLYSQGPAHMVLEPSTCVADVSKDNFGCLPPVYRTYIGHMTSRIELGFDVNGFSTDPSAFDIVKFSLASHTVGGLLDSFISGSKVIDSFGTTALLNGSVSDALVDPPFGINLSGPITAEQQIVAQSAAVPEPATLMLFGLGLAGLLRRRAAA